MAFWYPRTTLIEKHKQFKPTPLHIKDANVTTKNESTFTQICSTLAIVFALLFSSDTISAEPVWQAAGMSCTPSHSTNEGEQYVTTAGVIGLKSGNTGSITFICSVNSPLEDGFYRLRVHYSRNNVANPTSKISAALRSRTLIEKAEGLSHVSNHLVADNVGRGFSNFPFGTLHSISNQMEFDFEKNLYWVQVTITGVEAKFEGAILLRSRRKEPEQPPRTSSCEVNPSSCCRVETIPNIVGPNGELGRPPKIDVCTQCRDPQFGCLLDADDIIDQIERPVER